MGRVEILLWCLALILLEIQHLKWIVWSSAATARG
jgi:hypothetical protein